MQTDKPICQHHYSAMHECVKSGVSNFRFLFGDYGMTITNTKTTDKAIYECIASNIAGNLTKVITLIVESKLIIYIGSEE